MFQHCAKIKTIALRFDVGEKTVRAWINKGLISATAPDIGPMLVDIDSVSQYLTRKKHTCPETDTIVADILGELSMN